MKRITAFAARWSLRARLTVLSALGAAVVLPVVVVLLHGAVEDALDDAVTAELRVRAGDVAAELGAGVDPVENDLLVTQVLAADGSVTPSGGEPLLSKSELPTAVEEVIVRDRPVASVGDHARLLARRLPQEAGGGWVIVAGSTSAIREVEQRLAVLLGIAGPVLVLLVTATSWVLIRSALQPVRRMTRRASTLSLEEPHERLPQPPGRDEIAELGATLNSMLVRIEATVAHERAFVDDASHELRTPIAVLRGELELARLELGGAATAAEMVAAIDSALEETDRLARITEHLLVLARADVGRLADARERVALMTATAQVVDRVDAGAVHLQVSGVEAHVLADPDLVEQMITNLVTNAVRFARSLVQVTIDVVDDLAVVRIDDDGPGFAPELIGRAFDRFARGGASRSRSRGGTGLGLAIVAAIASALDGRVDITNDGALGGASVEVQLPRAHRST